MKTYHHVTRIHVFSSSNVLSIFRITTDNWWPNFNVFVSCCLNSPLPSPTSHRRHNPDLEHSSPSPLWQLIFTYTNIRKKVLKNNRLIVIEKIVKTNCSQKSQLWTLQRSSLGDELNLWVTVFLTVLNFLILNIPPLKCIVKIKCFLFQSYKVIVECLLRESPKRKWKQMVRN